MNVLSCFFLIDVVVTFDLGDMEGGNREKWLHSVCFLLSVTELGKFRKETNSLFLAESVVGFSGAISCVLCLSTKDSLIAPLSELLALLTTIFNLGNFGWTRLASLNTLQAYFILMAT
jgi:hypothetical protein